MGSGASRKWAKVAGSPVLLESKNNFDFSSSANRYKATGIIVSSDYEEFMTFIDLRPRQDAYFTRRIFRKDWAALTATVVGQLDNHCITLVAPSASSDEYEPVFYIARTVAFEVLFRKHSSSTIPPSAFSIYGIN